MIIVGYSGNTVVRCSCGWSRASKEDRLIDELEFIRTSWTDHGWPPQGGLPRPGCRPTFFLKAIRWVDREVGVIRPEKIAFVVVFTPEDLTELPGYRERPWIWSPDQPVPS